MSTSRYHFERLLLRNKRSQQDLIAPWHRRHRTYGGDLGVYCESNYELATTCRYDRQPGASVCHYSVVGG